MTLLLALLMLASPLPEGEVSGVVVDHLTNRPLSHVLVQLSPVSAGLEEFSLLTLDNGAFVFAHVPYGKYQLSGQKRSQPAQAFRGDGPYETAIVVGPKQDTRNIVFALHALASIHGAVMGDDGNPVANSSVTLIRQAVVEGEQRSEIAGATRTNADGQFRFSHLSRGQYYVAADGWKWMNQLEGTAIYPLTFYGGTRNPSEARVLSLREGDTSQVQIDLRAVPSIRVRLTEPQAQISLSALGPHGVAIPISTLTINQSSVAIDGAMQSFVGTAMVSPAPTALEYSGLAAGRYQVQFVTNQGAAPRSQGVVEMDLEEGSSIAPGSSPGCEVTGRVTFEQPPPAESSQLFLSASAAPNVGTVVRKDGTFHLSGIPAGEYKVVLGGQEFMAVSITSRGAVVERGKLRLPSSGTVELAIAAMRRQNLSALEGFALRGDAGLAGAMVLLLPQEDRPDSIRRDQSDSDGSFSLREVLPGRYTLLAIEDGHDVAYKDAAAIQPYLTGGVAISIPLKGEERVVVRVQKRLLN